MKACGVFRAVTVASSEAETISEKDVVVDASTRTAADWAPMPKSERDASRSIVLPPVPVTRIEPTAPHGTNW